MNRKVKSISFNLDDPFELAMYEYCSNLPNFSSFVKRLLQNTINTKQNLIISKPEPYLQQNQDKINIEYMKQLI